MANRIRVCHVITQLELGGAQDNTLYTVQSLPQDTYETFLISGPGGIRDEDARSKLGSRCQFFPSLLRSVDPLSDFLAWRALRRHFKSARYDIVHTHSSKAGVLGRLAAASAGVPLVFHTAHGWGFHDCQPVPVRSIFVLCERLAARCTTKIIGVSESTVQKGLAAGIGSPGQYALIRSGIDPRQFREERRQNTEYRDQQKFHREKFGFRPEAPLVTMVACLKPQKAPLDFVQLAFHVRKAHPTAQFALAGDGDLRPALESRLSELGLSDAVRLLGWRSDVPDLLRSSDLLVLTSRWEGLPRVFLEASAAGLPVVATNVDGAQEAVKEGVNGFLFSPGESEKMAARVSQILSDPQMLETLRAGARASWREEFDIRDMVRRIDGLYQTCLKET